MKFGRDAWLAAGVIVLLVLLTIAAAVQKAPVVPYLSTSSSADGTLALKLWLRALGYQVSDQSLATYQPPQDTDLILILQPVLKITDSEWQVIDQRVMNGAMLILAGDNLPSGDALHQPRPPLLPRYRSLRISVWRPSALTSLSSWRRMASPFLPHSMRAREWSLLPPHRIFSRTSP